MSPNGQAWIPVAGGDCIFCAIDPTNFSRMYVCNPCLYVNRSDNSGTDFYPKTTGIYGAGQNNEFFFNAPFIMDPVQPATLYGGGLPLPAR